MVEDKPYSRFPVFQYYFWLSGLFSGFGFIIWFSSFPFNFYFYGKFSIVFYLFLENIQDLIIFKIIKINIKIEQKDNIFVLLYQ